MELLFLSGVKSWARGGYLLDIPGDVTDKKLVNSA